MCTAAVSLLGGGCFGFCLRGMRASSAVTFCRGAGPQGCAVLPVLLLGTTAASTSCWRKVDPKRRNGRPSWGALEWGSAPCGQTEQMSGE